MGTRLWFLTRLAARNAARHRGQTARAVAGLMVATVVVAAALGIGNSAFDSVQSQVETLYGPIDITLKAQSPFDQELAGSLPSRAGVSGAGAGSLVLDGSILNERTGLAEAGAVLRGVSPSEQDVLGPLPLSQGTGGLRPGEVVLSLPLAHAIDAHLGDPVIIHVPRGSSTTDVLVEDGATTPIQDGSHRFQVEEHASMLLVVVERDTGVGNFAATLESPEGRAIDNTTGGTTLTLRIEAPRGGTWILTVRSDLPTNYQARAEAQESRGTTPLLATVAGIGEREGTVAIAGARAVLLALDPLQQAAQLTGVNVAYYAVDGDARAAADAMRDALPEDDQNEFLIWAAKDVSRDNAVQAFIGLTTVILVLSSFTLTAAGLLAYTLFNSIAETRRQEIGISRAMGLTRREAALCLTMEAALYSFLAALAGAAIGFTIAYFVVQYVGGSIDAVVGGLLELRFHLDPATIFWAVTAGSVFPLVVVALASRRFARMNPAAAMRGISDDPKEGRRWSFVWVLLLVLVGILCFSASDGWTIGVPLILAAVALIVWNRDSYQLSYAMIAIAVGVLTWSLYAVPGQGDELQIVYAFGRGALLAVGLSVLAVAHKRPYELVLWRARGRMRRSAFIGLSYLIARRRPVALTMSMIALVTVMVVVLGTILAAVSAAEPNASAGGYQILARSGASHDDFPTPLPDELSSAIVRADFVPYHEELRAPRYLRDGQEIDLADGTVRRFIGTTPAIAAGQQFELRHRDATYSTDEAAWQAVVDGEAIVVPEWALENNRLRLGETIALETAAFGPKEYHVAAGYRSGILDWRPFLPVADVQAMGTPQETMGFIRVDTDADPTDIARRLTATYATAGFTFTSLPEAAAQESQNRQAIAAGIQVFIALGLFVGLAATSFLASRAVLERMQDIGTLRAVGFERADVQGAFMLESMLTAGLGTVVGAGVGLLVSHSVWWNFLRPYGFAFQPPLLMLAGMAATVLIIAALAAREPARRAARLPPALAVRPTE